MADEKTVIEIPTAKGKIVAERNDNPEFGGLSVYFETESGDIADLVCITCKPALKKEVVEIYVFGDVSSDDASEKYTLNTTEIVNSFK